MDKVLCMKYLMFFFCLLVMIGGLCLVAVSVWVIIDPLRIVDLKPSPSLTVSACIAMFVGLLLSYVGYLGCCGTAVEHIQALLLFFVLVLLIFILQFVIAILLYFFAKKLRDVFFLKKLKEKYTGDRAIDSYSIALNHFMIKFECCGILGPDDFLEATLFKQQQPFNPVPEACCTRMIPEESSQILNVLYCMQKTTGYINDESCSSAITSLFEEYVYVLVACNFAVLAAEVFALWGSWYLYKKLND